MTKEKLEGLTNDPDFEKFLLSSGCVDLEFVKSQIRDHNWVFEIALDCDYQVVQGHTQAVFVEGHNRRFSEVKVLSQSKYYGWFMAVEEGYVELFIGLSQYENTESRRFEGLGYLMTFNHRDRDCAVGNIKYPALKGFGLKRTELRYKQLSPRIYHSEGVFKNTQRSGFYLCQNNNDFEDRSGHFELICSASSITQRFPFEPSDDVARSHQLIRNHDTETVTNQSDDPLKAIIQCNECLNI